MKPIVQKMVGPLVLLWALCGVSPAVAQEDEETEDPRPELTEEEVEKRKDRVEESAKRQLESSQNQVHIYQLVEEMTDELVADLNDLDQSVISPMAVRKLGVTPNLSADFASFAEATVISSISSQSSLTVKRCAGCDAVRSRQEDGEWVVTMGLAEQEDLEREAERIGVENFLNAHLSYFPGANVVGMQVEIMRASDGAILWSETYRSDSTTAAILRSGDRIMSRAERVEELERKLEERPEFGYAAHFGVSQIPYDIPDGGITGAAGGVRLFELLGDQQRWRYGIGAEGFANFSSGSGGEASSEALVGGFFGATLQYRFRPIDLNEAAFWTGPAANGFLAGTEGNSMAVEWGIDGIFQFRLGAGASLMYFVPVRFAGRDLGGLGYKVRLSFNW
ncbi:MAG: hypothetical protein ACOCV2_08535 [Persicimonas sp.]